MTFSPGKAQMLRVMLVDGRTVGEVSEAKGPRCMASPTPEGPQQGSQH